MMTWKKKPKVKENLKLNQKFKALYKTMLSSCLKCRKNTESKNPIVVNTKNWKTILLPRWAVCNSKNRIFLKNN